MTLDTFGGRIHVEWDPAAAVTGLDPVGGLLSSLKSTAEQLTDGQRLRAILTRAFAKFILPTAEPPPILIMG